MTIDKGILLEIYERLAEAIAAVARGNIRAVGVRLERDCTAAVLATGAPGPGCPAKPDN